MTSLYIATSLDGFIARPDGSLDWLNALPNPDQTDHGYHAFLAGVDTIVMGRSTYEEILGFGVEWPYDEQETFVVTTDKTFSPATPHTGVIHTINRETIESLPSAGDKKIWVVGGGKVITAFLNHELIDEVILSMIPIVLGDGIRLFPDQPKETWFELKSTERFSTGVVNLTYTRNTLDEY
jgi:dihydrofolate reductase